MFRVGGLDLRAVGGVWGCCSAVINWSKLDFMPLRAVLQAFICKVWYGVLLLLVPFQLLLSLNCLGIR